MIRKISLMVFISLISVSVFAQYELDIKIPVFKSVSYYAVAVPGEDEYSIPYAIANNQFYLESVRFIDLADTFFMLGNYEQSIVFAQEAIRQALLSDEFVAVELINETERLMNRAYTNNFAAWYPNEFSMGKEYYEESLIAHSENKFDQSIDLSKSSIGILASLQIPEAGAVPPPPAVTTPAAVVTGTRTVPLPSQYTVRPWATARDCLWNIAGYPWVFNDPRRWTELYEANRSRMPQPNNPDLIHPGFVINIPSTGGEVRQGMWDPNTNYGF